MNVSGSLTEFQRICERDLCSTLAAKHSGLTNRTVTGQSETYIHASVLGTDIEVYIYEDEAQFHRGGKLAGLYEHQDFDNADELKKALICGVLEAAYDKKNA
jgi:hypothetical protein